LSVYEKAIKYNPNDKKLHYGLGELYGLMEEYMLAIDEFSKAIVIDGEYFEAYKSRGYYFAEIGNKYGAIKDFSKAIKLNKNDTEVYNNRAYTYSEIGDIDSAISDYSIAISINPDDAELYYSRSKLLVKKKREEEALQDAFRAMELDFAPKYRTWYKKLLDSKRP